MLMPEMAPAATPNVIGRSSRARVLGETRSGQLPRAPDGRLEPRPAGAIGPIDWCHVGPESTRGTEGWLSLAPAWADPARASARSTASSECMARSGKNGERGRSMILFSANVRLFGEFPRGRGLLTLLSVVGNDTLWLEQILISTAHLMGILGIFLISLLSIRRQMPLTFCRWASSSRLPHTAPRREVSATTCLLFASTILHMPSCFPSFEH
ncbi:hypothetical protein TIFTF001_041050 [Ficus carica]|uniref:Uncharacterized protein n=1 Tax=Ficus carica TaxID=3494 RepID=A0AA87Z1A7_FICCA|nr:hypothetical protein TIFTF001_041050 [Ficus carica]